MKEHAGGYLPEGFRHVPLEWREDVPSPIAIAEFDWESLDSVADAAQEALSKGEFDGFLRRVIAHERREIQRDLLLQIVGFADHFSSRAKGVDLMLDACGLASLDNGKSGADYARQWGISRQAWQQERERMRRLLRLPITRTMRGATERRNMAMRNFRRA